MSKKLDHVREALSIDVKTDLQARKLAKVAAAALEPDAMAMEQKLDAAFRQIPIAERLRGESSAARDKARSALDEAEQASRKL